MGFSGQFAGSNSKLLISALGHKRTWQQVRVMSALPPKADMVQHNRDVRFVPKADIAAPIAGRLVTRCD
jgi:hypothetical protein